MKWNCLHQEQNYLMWSKLILDHFVFDDFRGNYWGSRIKLLLTHSHTHTHTHGHLNLNLANRCFLMKRDQFLLDPLDIYFTLALDYLNSPRRRNKQNETSSCLIWQESTAVMTTTTMSCEVQSWKWEDTLPGCKVSGVLPLQHNRELGAAACFVWSPHTKNTLNGSILCKIINIVSLRDSLHSLLGFVPLQKIKTGIKTRAGMNEWEMFVCVNLSGERLKHLSTVCSACRYQIQVICRQINLLPDKTGWFEPSADLLVSTLNMYENLYFTGSKTILASRFTFHNNVFSFYGFVYFLCF